MKFLLPILISFFTTSALAANKSMIGFLSDKSPQSYIVTISGDSVNDKITITLTPSRLLFSDEKVKIFITDTCDNVVHYDEVWGGGSTKVIYKSNFNGGGPYLCDHAGFDYHVEATYDLRDGSYVGVGNVVL